MDYYSTTSDYSYTSSSTLDPATASLIFGVAAVVGLVFYVIFSYFMARIFKKAGEKGWKAWVPVYNSWVFLEIGGQKGWIALLALAAVIPVVGWIGSLVTVVFMAIAAYKIGLHLQKEGWFVVLYILLTPVWLIWLAMDHSTWNSAPVTANANPVQPAQPAAPVEQPQAPQVATPQNPVQDQNNTPPTSPTVS